METVIIIGAIIQIITLVVFFIMAANIAKIKNTLHRGCKYNHYLDLAKEEEFVGNYTKAKECLLRAKYKLGSEIFETLEDGSSKTQVLHDIEEKLQSLDHQ